MAALSIGIATTAITARATLIPSKSFRPRICCSIGWDPEGLLGPPQTGHLARREFKKRLEKDAEAREAFEQQVREEKQRRQALRQSRVAPETPEELIEYFLDTEAQEIEFEIARLRRRLNQEFFSHLQFELGQLRFAVSKSQDMEDRLIELEALQKALLEGTEAYDKMQAELIAAKESLTKILTSKDVKATLLEMVERNELNRSLLTLLDENIANAHKGNQNGEEIPGSFTSLHLTFYANKLHQVHAIKKFVVKSLVKLQPQAKRGDDKQAAEFMEKLRGAVLRYTTV